MSSPDIQGSNASGIPKVISILNVYVQNELSTYLIYVPDKRLVGRDEVQPMFRKEAALIMEEAIQSSCRVEGIVPYSRGEDAIKDIVKGYSEVRCPLAALARQ